MKQYYFHFFAYTIALETQCKISPLVSLVLSVQNLNQESNDLFLLFLLFKAHNNLVLTVGRSHHTVGTNNQIYNFPDFSDDLKPHQACSYYCLEFKEN